MPTQSKKKSRSRETTRVARPQSSVLPPIAHSKFFLVKVLTIVIAGLWIFWPALHGDWLWDDEQLVSTNPLVHDPTGLWKIWFEPGNLVDYFPIKVSVEWFEWQLWQNNTLGYHLTNIVLHIISALLIWRLFDKLGLRFAWLGGLLFVIHPVTVESVAWISELKNTLSLPPFLLAMCAFIDYDEHGNWKDYFQVLGLFILAMLCKTTMVMFPVVILLYAWWKRGRIGWNDLKISVPFFVISFGMGLLTIWFLHHRVIGQYNISVGDFIPRLTLAGLSIAFYFSKCFWPVGLLPIYPMWVINPPSPLYFLPWPVLGGVVYWLWMKRAGWGRHALLGLGFFLINLLPFVGFITAAYMYFTWVMDHVLYIPLIGLIGLVVAGTGQVAGKLSRSAQPFAVGFVGMVMALLAWESHGYAEKYIDQETLWTYAIQHNPGAWIARNNLGLILSKTNRVSEAIEQYQEALKSNPEYAPAYFNLGMALFQANRFSESIERYQEALRINPDYADAHSNLGIVLCQVGRINEGIEEYKQAFKLNPKHDLAHNNLGLALVQKNQIPEAIEQYQEALKINPDFADAHFDLGNALAQSNRISEAIEQYQQALKINPDYIGAHNNLGNALAQAGRLSEAIDQYEQVIKLDPDNAGSRNNLGFALSQAHRIPEAIEQFEFSLKIDPHDVDVQNQLKQLQNLQRAVPTINSPPK